MTATDLSACLARDLPYLRRYARALTGDQGTGDRYALAALEAIVAAPDLLDADPSLKIGLFRVFHGIWANSDAPSPDAPRDETGDALLERRAQQRLRGLSPNTREALLLHAIEGFTFDAIAQIMGARQDAVETLYAKAMQDMGDMVTGDILIIEDEAIISMDLSAIVTEMGHSVTAIAKTHTDALAKGTAKVPDLILADIQLADKSSGVDAVNDLLKQLGDRPVIFVTAFPEQLLTGDRPEPAFLIAKPYSEEQVRAAVSQAMFFSTTQSISVPT